jgi:uncharacterized protein DUF3303
MEGNMTFVIIWNYPPERRAEVQERLKATGGPPPEGVEMIGRWFSTSGGTGVCIAETDDAAALGMWAQEWSDLMHFETYPAMDDQTVAKVIS